MSKRESIKGRNRAQVNEGKGGLNRRRSKVNEGESQ